MFHYSIRKRRQRVYPLLIYSLSSPRWLERLNVSGADLNTDLAGTFSEHNVGFSPQRLPFTSTPAKTYTETEGYCQQWYSIHHKIMYDHVCWAYNKIMVPRTEWYKLNLKCPSFHSSDNVFHSIELINFDIKIKTDSFSHVVLFGTVLLTEQKLTNNWQYCV